jgi:hypothetical protein
MVVQPGVEFDHHKVIDYRPEKARALSAFIEAQPGLVFEAHSTDYQTPERLAQLARDHFAILKVGPGVTFALRERRCGRWPPSAENGWAKARAWSTPCWASCAPSPRTGGLLPGPGGWTSTSPTP